MRMPECELVRMDTQARISNSGHRALRRGRVSLAGQVYHVTAATSSRTPIFADHFAAQTACRCFENPTLLHDARMLAWVLMPDHAHWLIELGEIHSLGKLVHGLKAFSAINVNRCMGKRGAIWNRAYYDRALRCDEDALTVAHYIIANPLRAGLVNRIGEYPYWNAIWL